MTTPAQHLISLAQVEAQLLEAADLAIEDLSIDQYINPPAAPESPDKLGPDATLLVLESIVGHLRANALERNLIVQDILKVNSSASVN